MVRSCYMQFPICLPGLHMTSLFQKLILVQDIRRQAAGGRTEGVIREFVEIVEILNSAHSSWLTAHRNKTPE
jgi:hypothetical protein